MKYFIILSLFFKLYFGFVTSTAAFIKDDWDQVNKILKNIIPPTFPDRNYLVTDYGAVGDGKTDCTESFKNAIDECTNHGGGRVIVPEGTYITGAIHLKSNVNLYISAKAIVRFSTDKSKYLPVVETMWEGTSCFNYSPLIYANGQENIAITGKGILDGQGSDTSWWNWKGKKEYGWKEGNVNQNEDRKKLMEMAEHNIPVKERIFGDGHYLRPVFCEPYNCKRILIEGITFKNSPMWFIHPVLCNNVSVIGVTVDGLGPNNDGCDPECTKNILIEGCNFNTGDDCIAIKSGRNADGRKINISSEDIIIRNCKMKEGHGGVVIGSEISGGVRNIFTDNCEMDSPNLERAIRIKTNSVRGGVIENIFIRNIKIGQVKEAVVLIDFYYEEGDKGKFDPVVRNIRLKNITSGKSAYAFWLKGYERSQINSLYIEDCSFNNVEKGNIIENVTEVKIHKLKINGKSVEKIN